MTQSSPKGTIQNKIDESIDETFPASDPPAWTVSKNHSHYKATSPVNFKHHITIEWQRTTADFDYENYNREARLTFAGGHSIQVSNPHHYFGDEKLANSEELLISAVALCYMQTFLAVASKMGYTIKSYKDESIGILGLNDEKKMSITEIQHHIKVAFEGVQPIESIVNKIQEKAHINCFIANSVKSKVSISIQLIK
jgi:organic hydroperoxide reductase OsmC/OhrA